MGEKIGSCHAHPWSHTTLLLFATSYHPNTYSQSHRAVLEYQLNVFIIFSKT